jgi:hypothetical protein
MGKKIKKCCCFHLWKRRHFFRAPMAAGLRILPIEEGYYETVELRARHRDLRAGIGLGNPCRRHIPGGLPDVYCGVSAHCLRHMLYAAMKGGRELKIIVWKAPAFLRGILKCIFCSKE